MGVWRFSGSGLRVCRFGLGMSTVSGPGGLTWFEFPEAQRAALDPGAVMFRVIRVVRLFLGFGLG